MASSDFEKFQNETRALLRLSGSTTGELRLGHKKVDLLVESRRFGREWRTAVECKAFSRALHMTEVAEVIRDYAPLIADRQVEEVLLVTSRGVSPDGEGLIRREPSFAHMTFDELSNETLDLSGYMRGLADEFDQRSDGISQYYIPARDSDGNELLELLDNWDSIGFRPVAVLGAYGSGKSSFASSYAAHLASVAAQDPVARRPILISLADISAEQTLEGLIGRVLGATSGIPNYSFERFMSLNRAGRFVVILDGFDEMKRMLTWEEFRHNFEQLNRLVAGKSRVLLLGRPTAFLNDEEFDLALHGVEQFGDMQTRIPDWPDYLTLSIAPFSSSEVTDFLRRYLWWAAEQRAAESDVHKPVSAKRRDAAKKKQATEINHQVERVKNGHLRDLTKRPVQLKMLAEILPTYRGSLEALDTTELFDQFIDRIIQRDSKKITRTRFTTKERRKFATDVAWWLWTESKQSRVTPDQIPDAIVSQFLRPDEHIEAVRRDLVAACFLDRAHGGPLVFPHRSFQEFLVAQRALELLSNGQASIPEIDGVLNAEVAEFMYGLAGRNELKGALDALGSYRGEISSNLARLWTSDAEKSRWLHSEFERDPRNLWQAQLLTWAAVRSRKAREGELAGLEYDLLGQLSEASDPVAALLRWRCVLSIGAATENAPIIEEATLRLLESGEVGNGLSRRAGDIQLRDSSGKHTSRWLRPDPKIATVVRGITFSSRKKTMDLHGAYWPLAAVLRDNYWLKGAPPLDGLPTSVGYRLDGLPARRAEYIGD